ncbi:MFS transporter [Saccharopolyspora erythraea]|uniref:MFS transporter n=1 Tax=Saccharopolyspora erythraea TaxID=1836 RepID=UPI00038D2DE9|nr:MFS transporter [Saccharopolyspora erythraea]EQD81642.1 hypothetical protein N599_35010 [Saccharopolyspora erythraea D]QRK87220.1 MFS transporter [Saccharopolyspora erythraea]
MPQQGETGPRQNQNRATAPARTGGEPVRWAPAGTTITLMTVTGLLVVGQLYAVIPLLPAMARDWGGTHAEMTATSSLFGIAYAVGFLLTGPLSDRFGRRRVVVTGLTAMAVTTLAIAFAPSLAAGGTLRVVQGLCAAGFSPAALAYLTERLAPRHRPVALSCLVTSFTAAAITGQVSAQALLEVSGWQGFFAVSAAAIAVVVVLLRIVMLPDAPQPGGSLPTPFRVMARLVVRPQLALVCLAALSVLSSFAGLYVALQLLGPPVLVRSDGAMLALRLSAFPAMVAIPLAAPLLNRYRATHRAGLALAAGAAATLALTAAGDSVLVVGVLMLVFVTAIMVVSPGLTQLVSELGAPARGAAVALYTFALLVGASVGPQLVAVIRDAGFTAVLVVLGAVQVAGAVLVAVAGGLAGRGRGQAEREGAQTP